MKKTVSKQTDSTHFGYETVDREAKASKVRAVFESVAPSYDLMNDLMSLGVHRAWKAFTLGRTGLRAGDVALDLAAGTGDLTAGMAQQVGEEGQVFHTDINPAMLAEGRDRLFDRSHIWSEAVCSRLFHPNLFSARTGDRGLVCDVSRVQHDHFIANTEQASAS